MFTLIARYIINSQSSLSVCCHAKCVEGITLICIKNQNSITSEISQTVIKGMIESDI